MGKKFPKWLMVLKSREEKPGHILATRERKTKSRENNM